jgi:hypothetical protein
MTTPDIQSKHGMTTGLKKILRLCEGDMSIISKKKSATCSVKKRKPAVASQLASPVQTATRRTNKKQKTIEMFLSK